MEYITGYDVSIATYIVELIEEEISDDTRNSLKEYLTNLDLSIETINMMLDSLTEKNTTIEEGNRIYEYFMNYYVFCRNLNSIVISIAFKANIRKRYENLCKGA